MNIERLKQELAMAKAYAKRLEGQLADRNSGRDRCIYRDGCRRYSECLGEQRCTAKDRRK